MRFLVKVTPLGELERRVLELEAALADTLKAVDTLRQALEHETAQRRAATSELEDALGRERWARQDGHADLEALSGRLRPFAGSTASVETLTAEAITQLRQWRNAGHRLHGFPDD